MTIRSSVRHLAAAVAVASTLIAGSTAVGSHERAAAAVLPAAAAHSVTFVTDVGGLNDNGFNHLGYIGTLAGAKTAGYTAHYIETTSASDYVKNLTSAAQQSRLVVAVGFSFATAMPAVAAKFPKDHFVIIDYNYSPTPKNIQGNIFKPEQSSYLAGILAAGISKTHKVGFVGGVKGPVIDAFYGGFQAGARAYDPSVKVIGAYTGSFIDQSIGATTAQQEIGAGADVIYAAAGGSGLGALAAADQHHLFSIGVDADQHALHPKTIITSAVKHVEVAVAQAIVADGKGQFLSGTRYWDLANNGVGLASYHNLSGAAPSKVQHAIAQAAKDIISGKIKVPTAPSA